jgi:hypothetical protein
MAVVHYHLNKIAVLVLSWAIRINSVPSHPMSLRSILILSSHICLHFLESPLMFFCQNLYLLVAKKCNFAFTRFWFYLTILTMNFEECNLWSCLLCRFLWPPVTLCTIGQNIPFISLFSWSDSQSLSFCHRSVWCNLQLPIGLHNNTVTNTRVTCNAMLITKKRSRGLFTVQ